MVPPQNSRADAPNQQQLSCLPSPNSCRTCQALACKSRRVRYACASASGEPRVPIFSVLVSTAAEARVTVTQPRGCRCSCRQLLCLGRAPPNL